MFNLTSLRPVGMKATARAHPIQGLIKYHGMRDSDKRYPYHDSISVCTAPSATTTTVEFQSDASTDVYIIDDERVEGEQQNELMPLLTMSVSEPGFVIPSD